MTFTTVVSLTFAVKTSSVAEIYTRIYIRQLYPTDRSNSSRGEQV